MEKILKCCVNKNAMSNDDCKRLRITLSNPRRTRASGGLNVIDLRRVCKRFNLVDGGNRVILVRRIRKHLNTNKKSDEPIRPMASGTTRHARLDNDMCMSCVSGNEGRVVFTGGVLLAKDYMGADGKTPRTDPTGYWISEKYDGYRATWNGLHFVSRSKKRFHTPLWFTATMPPGVALDGELWMGRETFGLCGLLRRKTPVGAKRIAEWSEEWRKGKVRYKVFDLPDRKEPFEDRMVALEAIVGGRRACFENDTIDGKRYVFPIEFVTQTRASSPQHVRKVFAKVVHAGGEGVMLREPASSYENKRSPTLLKYKLCADMECEIVGYKPGRGKYEGMLGAFQCEMVARDGKKTRFMLAGMDDCIRRDYATPGSKNEHPIGTMLTFKYNGLTNKGKPRHPRYLRKKYAV